MDIRQLEHFVAVAEDGHFTQAARRLRVAQSTISSSVRSLEAEIDALLFARTTRRVQLTDVGRALLPEARRALAAIDTARAAVDAVVGLSVGRVAVGTGKALDVDIAEQLVQFSADHPGVDVSLMQGGSLELLEAVADARLDFAPLGLVGRLPPHLEDAVVLRELHKEPMVLACSPGHRLAARKAVSLRDTTEDRFADVGSDWAIRIVNDHAFAHLGQTRRVAYVMNDIDDLLAIVRHGLAVAIVPRSVSQRSTDVRFLALRGQAPTWRVGVAVARGRPPSPAAQALFDTVFPSRRWPS
jgi:DNA-binding transcriptional LysR family regulator